jgi:hypothetical protein
MYDSDQINLTFFSLYSRIVSCQTDSNVPKDIKIEERKKAFKLGKVSSFSVKA